MIREEFPEVRLVVMPNSAYGACETFNVGFSTALTEYIAILDDDVVLPPGWLERSLERMGREPETTAVVSTKVVEPGMPDSFRDAEALNRATVDLFKEHKVNPVGGCLPMFIQMPVFLALFYVLMYSADLYHTEFLYLRDLSSPDPYCLLPSVVVAIMLIQQQFTPMGNMDPAQARMMRLMPLMFGVLWFMFPSGLVVYYFVNTVLSILQQWWIRRTFSTAPPAPAVAP